MIVLKGIFHLIGDGVNEVHVVYAGDPKALEKWQASFALLLQDAFNDGVDIEVIVVRSVKKEPAKVVYIT